MHGMRLGSAVVVQSKIMHYGTQWTHGIVNPSICGLATPLLLSKFNPDTLKSGFWDPI